MQKITFINQKGGVGKTTTCLNVGAALSRSGYKVLLIDMDAQGNLTASAGIKDLTDETPTVYEVLNGKADINDAIRAGQYDLLPTDLRLSGAEIELASVPGRDVLLKEALQEIRAEYDYILIDCPPSLSIITLMALAASDYVIIPVQAQILPLNGMAQLLNTIRLVQKRLNDGLQIMGAVVTMYDSRKTLNREVLEYIEKTFPGKVFETKISNNVSLAEAPAFGKDVFAYKPDCKGAAQYEALKNEIIERGTEK